MKKEPTVRTTVLLPESLYAKIRRIADAEKRSAHKQIIYFLERCVSEEEEGDAKGDPQ